MVDAKLFVLNASLRALRQYPPASNFEASELINECVQHGLPIPIELNKFVGKANRAWIKDEGNRFSTKVTKKHRDRLIWHIRLYIHQGEKPGKAIEYVAGWSGQDAHSLRTYYYSSRSTWAGIDHDISLQEWDWDNPYGDDIL